MRKLVMLFLTIFMMLAGVAGNRFVKANPTQGELRILMVESEQLQSELAYLRAHGIEKAYAPDFAYLKDNLKTMILFGMLGVFFLASLMIRLFFRMLQNFGKGRKDSLSQLSSYRKERKKLFPSIQ